MYVNGHVLPELFEGSKAAGHFRAPQETVLILLFQASLVLVEDIDGGRRYDDAAAAPAK
jgi:hypothetical protein